MLPRQETDRQRRGLFQYIGRNTEDTAKGTGAVQLHADIQRLPTGINPHTGDERLPLRAQTDKTQQTVPVGLGFVRGGGGIDDGVTGPGGIAVIRQENQFIMAGDQARNFKTVRGGQGGGLSRLRFPAVYQQAKLPGPLHIHKDAALRHRPVHRTGDACQPLEGIFPGQPGDDGIPVPVKTDAAYLVHLPLTGRIVPEADAAFIQASRQAQGGAPAGYLALPYSRKIFEHSFFLLFKSGFDRLKYIMEALLLQGRSVSEAAFFMQTGRGAV